MNRTLEPYMGVVDFLADFLGENTEVVLHDLTDLESSIVKIRNSHISGRKVNDPITDFVMKYMTNDDGVTKYKCNYRGASRNNEPLKCASYFIRDARGELAGVMCINIRIAGYLAAKQFLDTFFSQSGEDLSDAPDEANENFGLSIPEMIDATLSNVLSSYSADPGRFTQQEKEEVIQVLQDEGIFMLKGAVSKVADTLQTSEPTIYRYLAKLKKR